MPTFANWILDVNIVGIVLIEIFMTDLVQDTKAFEVVEEGDVVTIKLSDPSVIEEPSNQEIDNDPDYFPTKKFIDLFDTQDKEGTNFKVLKAHEEAYFAIIELITTLGVKSKGCIIDPQTGQVLKKGLSPFMFPVDYQQKLEDEFLIIENIAKLSAANVRVYNDIIVDFGPNIVDQLKVDIHKNLFFINEGTNILENIKVRNTLLATLTKSICKANGISFEYETSDEQKDPYLEIGLQIFNYCGWKPPKPQEA